MSAAVLSASRAGGGSVVVTPAVNGVFNIAGIGVVFEVSPVPPPVELAGNLGAPSSYGKLSYGLKHYSQGGPFAPILAADLSLVPIVDLAGGLTPTVSFAADLSLVPVVNLAGGLTPAVSFAADLDVHVNTIDLSGGIAPQIALGGALSLDLPLVALAGGLTPLVALGASSFISGPLWAATPPAAPPWVPSEPCPPSLWTPIGPCDPVTWKKSELCNG